MKNLTETLNNNISWCINNLYEYQQRPKHIYIVNQELDFLSKTLEEFNKIYESKNYKNLDLNLSENEIRERFNFTKIDFAIKNIAKMISSYQNFEELEITIFIDYLKYQFENMQKLAELVDKN